MLAILSREITIMKFGLNRLSQLISRPEQTQIALGMVAIVALIFGFWQLKTAIRLPIGLVGTSETNTSSEGVSSVGEDVAKLQGQDSDQDGLSDYDELYIYKTSPYLADTDSDGYDDKTEVTSGNDPNCAPNTKCQPVILIQPNTENEPGSSPTAEQIRNLLRQAGISEADLAKYDDAELLKLYQEVSGEINVSGDTSDGAGDKINLTPEQKQLISQMSGAELRQFLINGGVAPAALQGVNDATLKALVMKQLGI